MKRYARGDSSENRSDRDDDLLEDDVRIADVDRVVRNDIRRNKVTCYLYCDNNQPKNYALTWFSAVPVFAQAPLWETFADPSVFYGYGGQCNRVPLILYQEPGYGKNGFFQSQKLGLEGIQIRLRVSLPPIDIDNIPAPNTGVFPQQQEEWPADWLDRPEHNIVNCYFGLFYRKHRQTNLNAGNNYPHFADGYDYEYRDWYDAFWRCANLMDCGFNGCETAPVHAYANDEFLPLYQERFTLCRPKYLHSGQGYTVTHPPQVSIGTINAAVATWETVTDSTEASLAKKQSYYTECCGSTHLIDAWVPGKGYTFTKVNTIEDPFDPDFFDQGEIFMVCWSTYTLLPGLHFWEGAPPPIANRWAGGIQNPIVYKYNPTAQGYLQFKLYEKH